MDSRRRFPQRSPLACRLFTDCSQGGNQLAVYYGNMEAAVYTLVLARSSLCTDAKGKDDVVAAIKRGERRVTITADNPFGGETQEIEVAIDALLTIIKHDVAANPAVRRQIDAAYNIVSMNDYVARRNRAVS